MDRRSFVRLLAATPLSAWSPRMHEAQTAKAVKLIPKRMAAFLRAYPQELLEGARGQANDQPPTLADLESQWRTILRLSEEKRRDGGAEYTLNSYSLEWTAQWLLSFGERAEAVAPAKLRQLVRTAAEKIAAKHG